MTNSFQSKQADGIRLFMYCSEIIIVNVMFYVFYKNIFAPYCRSIFDASALYGWMSMALTISYIVGVWIKPVAFYYRGSRAGTIFENVSVAVLIMAATYLIILSVFGRVSMLRDSNSFVLFSLWRPTGMFIAIACFMILWRTICRTLLRYIRRAGQNIHRVVFVGGGDNIYELFEEMNNPIYGYSVEGYFNESQIDKAPKSLQYLGKVEEVYDYLKSHDVHQLYCSLPSSMSHKIVPLINYCEKNFIRFFSVPNVRNYLKRQMNMEILGSVPVLYMREEPLNSLGNRIIKRTFDIVVSGLFMIPFWIIIYPIVAIISKITQPGPVFFKQQRNGLNGAVFYCYKFRSMKENADADVVQATENDPRKTKFGELLRRTNIDELPQFINVLKGDMSIVGPRPHMLKHTADYSALIDKYMVRHWVKPGITGWAQVTGSRGETRELWQMEERIVKDIWYIEHWSPWLDIRIIFMTIVNSFGGDMQAY